MMNLWRTFQHYIAGAELARVKRETQEAAHMLLRRDLELTAANEKLERLNSAKADFMAMAAHQLRTPLTSVRWNVEILQSVQHDKTAVQEKLLVDNVNQAAQQMAELIDTLLYVSRLELGTNVTHNTLFDLDEFIPSLTDRFLKQAQEGGLDITIEAQVGEVFADRSLFDVVIQNLVSNAIKYTPSGGKITINAQIISPHEEFGFRTYMQRQLALLVRDTGYGIPEGEREKIFSRLFRAANVQDKGISGTGLGLYLVKLIVNQLGGEVWFVSREGEGTTFFVTIPYALVRKS